MFKLIIEDDEGHTTVVPLLKEETTIGRKDGNTIRLTERNVSRHHARMIRANGSVFIEDLDSYNGVKVNGGKITARTTIREGDLVEIGDYHLALQRIDKQEEQAIERQLAKAQAEQTGKSASQAQQDGSGSRPPSHSSKSQSQTSKSSQKALSQTPPPPPGSAGKKSNSAQQAALGHTPPLPAEVPSQPRGQHTKPPSSQSQMPNQSPTGDESGTAVLRMSQEGQAVDDVSHARGIPGHQAASFVVINTEMTGQIFVLNRTELIIGRTEDNDLVLPHRSVSSRHAKIVFDGGVYRILDLDSANGVLVNGEEYARVDIRKADIVELGHVKLRYVSPEEDVHSIAATVLAQQAASGANQSIDDEDNITHLSPAPRMKSLFYILIALAVGVGGVAILHDTSSLSNDSDYVTNDVDMSDESSPFAQEEAPATANAPGGSDQSEASEYYQQGLEQIRTSDWDSAALAFRTALRLDSENRGAQEMLKRVIAQKAAQEQLARAKRAIEKKDWDEAYNQISAIDEGLKASIEADVLKPEIIKNYRVYHLNKAERLEKTGKIQEAIKEFDAVLVVDENNFLAKSKKEQLQKRLALLSRRSTKSTSTRKQSSTKERSKTPVQVSTESKRKPTQETRKKGMQPQDLRKKGIEAYKKNQFPKALSYYQKALKANPRDYELHRLIGAAYARMGNGPQAYQAYKRYVQACPNCMYTPQIRGFLKDYEESL